MSGLWNGGVREGMMEMKGVGWVGWIWEQATGPYHVFPLYTAFPHIFTVYTPVQASLWQKLLIL
jgi:hypothetical protein